MSKTGPIEIYEFSTPEMKVFWSWVLQSGIKIEALELELGLPTRSFYRYLRRKGSNKPMHVPKLDILKKMLDFAGYELVVRKKKDK